VKIARVALAVLVALTGASSVTGLAYTSTRTEPTGVAVGTAAPPAAPTATTPSPRGAPAPSTTATPTPTRTPTAEAEPARRTPPSRTSRNNAERNWSCDAMPGGTTVCEGDVPESVGPYLTPKQWKAREVERERRAESEAALEACTEQTGMTRAECIADAEAGNAS